MTEPGATPLFRAEAARHRGSRFGRVAIALPLSSWVLTMVLLTVLLTLGTFLTLGRYARKETVPGYVVPSGGVVDVHAPRAGVVDRVYVGLGARVNAGDPLFSVRDPARLPRGGDVSSQIGQRIERQIAHAAGERASLLRLFARTIERLDHAVVTTRQELETSTELFRLARQRLGLAERSLEAREALARSQALSADQLRHARAELLSMQMEFRRAQADRRRLESRLPELRLQREEAAEDRDRQTATLDSGLDRLRGQLIEWRAREALVTVAPITGVVALSQVESGQPANVQAPAMTIVPDGSELVVRLLIPSRAKAFVEPGQAVRIMYDAFPYQHFGAHEGSVADVSSTSVAGHHVLGPLSAQEPVYLAAVRLRERHFQAYGRRYHVQPGMTVKADIILAERRLVAWLVEPLLRVRG